MIVIGERINSTRKTVKEAIARKDARFLQKLAVDQVQAGADYVDVNAGAFPEEEVALMAWLAQVVQEAVEVPLVLDSANAAALEAGLQTHRNGTAIINSITAEEVRFKQVLPLVLEHKTPVMALAMGDGEITRTPEDRLKVARRLIEALCAEGVPPDQIYLDPMIQPVSVQNDLGVTALEVIRRIKQDFPGVRAACGLSNISFGLPQRAKLNRCFLTMALAAGLDCAILDPLDRDMMDLITTSEALLGKDRFCKRYIKAFRERSAPARQ